ncbi:unnamed protein product [Moneuplotes crassus]|uniref:Cytochrome P450 n=1 Tax=Euplotes crassus TaxID=5936 RepID=A0AAD1XCR7_EUPCR|nr:unnamed protein product [Moneuplotes crassus]
MLDIVLPILKWTGLVLLSYFIYMSYKLLLYPYMCWRKFKNYSNVYVTPKFVPLLGDLKMITEDIQNGKTYYAHRVREAPFMKGKDLKLKFEGYTPLILVESNQALEELCKLVPSKIDRTNTNKGLGRIGRGTLLFERSTKRTIVRRKLMTSFLSLNSSSRHIPAMVRHAIDVLHLMKDGHSYDFIEHSNLLTFNVFTSILFGDDMIKLANKLRPYKLPDGTTEFIPMRDLMIKLFKAYFAQNFHPLTSTCHFLSDFNLDWCYNLINPFKRDYENYLVYMQASRELYDNCKDEESICKQILKNDQVRDEDKLHDLNAFIFAGAETSSHAIVSTLFFLKKSPKAFEKLKAELCQAGITKEYLEKEELTKEKLEELDYLACVIKETLRMDNPAAESFYYAAYEDVEICGVPIPKGFPIKIDYTPSHYNDDYWKDPHSFIPERFDSESEFYKQAHSEGKAGVGFSRRGFSHGLRACAGQTFAILEIKVAVVVILTFLQNYEVPDELLKKSEVGFAIGSTIPAMFKVLRS